MNQKLTPEDIKNRLDILLQYAKHSNLLNHASTEPEQHIVDDTISKLREIASNPKIKEQEFPNLIHNLHTQI